MHTESTAPGGVALVMQAQQWLQGIYDADSAYRIHDFLITDPQLAQHLEGSDTPPASEKLLLRSDDEGLALSLYLEAAVLQRLEGVGRVQDLAPQHLPDFLTVLEGVSHFVYVTWNAGFERPVTPLELEMQAEVDKFISAGLLLAGRGGPPDALHRWLFDSFRWVEGLSERERTMYRDASDLAARYCRMLQQRFLESGDRQGLMRELRRFWRLSRNGKIGRIREL